MIIVNADDFGRSRLETDLIVECHRAGRITSTTAMMFMEDSTRAADLGNQIGMDVGLHLNLSQRFNASNLSERLLESHQRVVRFLTISKYALVVYNPLIRQQFRDVVEAQVEEFVRLYGGAPSHIDGHQHQHLCANVLLDGLIPTGHPVRRSFSFWRGEKGRLNRSYRALVDRALARNHPVADFFFSLEACLQDGRVPRVYHLARCATVELMTHPLNRAEYEYLMSDAYLDAVSSLTRGTYSAVTA